MPRIDISPGSHRCGSALRATLASGLGRPLRKDFKQMCSMASLTSTLTALNCVTVTLRDCSLKHKQLASSRQCLKDHCT